MLKNNKGFTGTDIAISIIAIIIFTSTILALMYNVKIENLKIKAKLVANIYLTEALENVGIAKYDEVSVENIENLVPQVSDAYQSHIEISKVSEEENTDKTEDIIKKVTVKISYKIGNKTYEESAERLKIKE